MLGKTEWRLMTIILLTALIPLAMAVSLAGAMFRKAQSVSHNADVEAQLDRGVAVYKLYIKAVRDDMKHQGDAIAADETVREAARKKDGVALQKRLAEIFPAYPELVSLTVDEGGEVLAKVDRGRSIDDGKEKKLNVPRSLGAVEGGPQLNAVFAFDSHYEAELEQAAVVIKNYKDVEADPGAIYAPVIQGFSLLVGATAVISAVLGFIFARGVTRRINRLSIAINLVAAGDLDVRVPVTGSDELTELARVFNRMLSEMQQSRARIEYLQRIGAWQEMAQRLAHEIKNPLTPIQLAVQECHRKYVGEDKKFRALLDTTLEIVEEEVGTLRRLVGNFSSFARLPQVELREADLRDFLRECSEQLAHLEDAAEGADVLGTQDVSVEFEVPESRLPAAFDKQMLRRVLVNLVRNSVQAIRDARGGKGRVVVTARPEEGGVAIAVDDDGPGVMDEMRDRIFDPYFTTKQDGTGLGLAIVKKVVVEHGGSIEATNSVRLGGASFVVHLPGPHSLALVAARERGAAGGIPAPRPSTRAVS